MKVKSLSRVRLLAGCHFLLHLLGTSKSLQKKHIISSGLSHGSQEIKRGQEGAAPGASGAWGPGHLWLEKGSHSLLQGAFPTQGSNPGLLHCRQIFYHLSHLGSPSTFFLIGKNRQKERMRICLSANDFWPPIDCK